MRQETGARASQDALRTSESNGGQQKRSKERAQSPLAYLARQKVIPLGRDLETRSLWSESGPEDLTAAFAQVAIETVKAMPEAEVRTLLGKALAATAVAEYQTAIKQSRKKKKAAESKAAS